MPSIVHSPSKQVDTVVVGNGPSALFLSYILNGHVPRYSGVHPDEYLHDSFISGQSLLHFDAALYNHSCITWSYEPERAIDHIVVGDTHRTGGQWADNPVHASWNIGTLSYAEQLSLPGYTFADHWKATRHESLPELIRPSRTQVAEYLAVYPEAVGIGPSIRLSEHVSGITRTRHGFHVASHGLHCKHLVLASGTFNISLPPPRSLAPFASLHGSEGPILVIGSGFTAADIIISTSPERSILHVFNWDPGNRPSPLKGCHSQAYPEYAWVYKQMKIAAMTGTSNNKAREKTRYKNARAKDISSLPNFSHRDWNATYFGFPGGHATAVQDDDPHSTDEDSTGDKSTSDSSICSRVAISVPDSAVPVVSDVSALYSAVGRRGSLAYLSPSLLQEVLSSADGGAEGTSSTPPDSLPKLTRLSSFASSTIHDPDPWTGDTESQLTSPVSSEEVSDAEKAPAKPTPTTPKLNTKFKSIISGQTLRGKIEETDSMEVAKDVFAIGSLTGDSLVRYALGGCCVVAGSIMDAAERTSAGREATATPKCDNMTNGVTGSPLRPNVNGQHTKGTNHDFHSREHRPQQFPLDRRKPEDGNQRQDTGVVASKGGWRCVVL